MTRLGDSIQRWLELYKRNSVKPTTFTRLHTSLTLLAKDSIYDILLSDLQRGDIQGYINRLVDAGYSQSTIKKQYCLIGAYLDFAVMEGIFRSPIHRGVVLPSQSMVKAEKREVRGYSEADQRLMRQAFLADGRAELLAALFMMETGLRVGECLALQQTDILWGRRALRVDKTMIRVGDSNRWVMQEGAKSFTSNRTIPLSERAMDILRRLTPCDGFVFATGEHEGLTYEQVRWHVQKTCKQLGVAYLGMHAFRHTFATNCYHRGCDVKILSRLLGHADVAVTYNVYIHLYGDALEEMRSVLG